MSGSRAALVDGAPVDHVSAWELGLLLGHGAFETMRSAGEGVRALALHVERLRASLARVGLSGLDAPLLAREISRARAEIAGDALLRAIVAARAGGGLLRVVLAEPHVFAPCPPVVAVTVQGTRALADAKLTSYGESWAALAEARARGATEALLVRDGLVGEGATSNVFLADGERLITAPDDGTILAGITRRLVLDAAARLGVDVEFARPSVARLVARGGFVTSTRRGLAALAALDGAPLPPPPLLGRLLAAYDPVSRAPGPGDDAHDPEGRDPPATP